MLRYLILITVISFTTACGGGDHQHHASPSDMEPTATQTAMNTPDSFRAELTTALQAYFDLSTALIETNATDAKANAALFANAFAAVDGSVLSGEARTVWSEYATGVPERALAIQNENDVEKQRYNFEYLSADMIMLVKSLGVNETVYEQTCPMVRGGSANWLAPQENILNPYHGSRMLRCGSVVSVIS